MGMNFSPMYQPITSSNMTVDGDLNLSPYDVIAYDGKFDTVEAGEFVGGVGNFSSLEVKSSIYPKYNISREVLPNPKFTFQGARWGSPQNQSIGTRTWFEGILFSSERANSLFTLAKLALEDYIPITINSQAANPTARYVALYVDGVEVLRTTSEGAKTYQLSNDEFNKVVKIDYYIDRTGYAADVCNATVGSGYIY